MTRPSRRSLLAALLLPALAAFGCGPGDHPETLSCGDGTENRNGTCVAVVDPISSCGDGTIFDEDSGKCEPTVQCGEGTEANDAGECVAIAECGPGTELDLGTRQCIPVASCGPGTVLDESTGECTPEVSCGVGTVLEDGECVAVGTCGSGSVLNLDTGMCESSTECGPGQVIAGGLCVDPNVAVGLEADAVESAPENNDPLFGGTPEPLTLEALGEETVFVGNIGRPVDLAGDGTLAQDRDVWSFAGATGQYLKISVLGTGLPQPAFILEGPNGYRRVSRLLSTNDTSREVVLPYGGQYELTVVPTAFVSTDLPLGSANSGYVGVIEQLAQPIPTSIVPAPNQLLPVEVSGSLGDLSDNFFVLDADVGDAISLVFKDASTAVPPAILAFDASGALISHVDLDLAFGAWVGTLVKDEAGTTIVVDWQSSTSANDAFTLQVAEIPHVQGGAVAPGVPSATATTAIPGYGMAAFTVALEEAAVFNWDIDDTQSPDLQLRDDNGVYSFIADDDAAFFYAEPSTYTFFVYNDASFEDDAAALLSDPLPVIDLGTLNPDGQDEVRGSGHLLSEDIFGPESAWLVVRTSSPGLVRISAHVQIGTPELVLHSASGIPMRVESEAFHEVPMHALLDGAPVLIELVTDGPTLEWEVAASASPYPMYKDVEPNDVGDTAVDLGALPAAIVGDLGPGAVDLYRFTLDEPLAAGRAIEVQVENLLGTGGYKQNSTVALYDELLQPLVTQQASLNGNNVRTFIHPVETQSNTTFFVEMTKTSSADSGPYLLRVLVVDQPMDQEPNDTPENADIAEALPATWAGQGGAADALDYFSFTLDQNLSFFELLRVRYFDLTGSNNSLVVIEDQAGNALAQESDDDVDIVVPALTAGQYFISVDGPTNAIDYRLEVEVIPVPPWELEANDSASAATLLGELSAGSDLYRFGLTTSNDADWLSFTVPAPLGDDEGIRLRCLNPFTTTKLDCELYDLADVSVPVLLGRYSDDEAAFAVSSASGGPFGIRILGTSTSETSWYARVDLGPEADSEPNNDIATAQPLGLLTVDGVLVQEGNVDSSDRDCFGFTVNGVLPGNASVRVSYDNLTDSSSIASELYSITDPSSPVVLSYASDDVADLVSAPTGGISYAVCLVGTSSTSKDSYRLTIDAGPRAEAEPNDVGAEATPLGALPASIHGRISNGTADVYSVTLASDLDPAQGVEVYFDNLTDTTSYDVSFRAAGDTSRPQQIDGAVGFVYSAAGLAAGTYEIQIDGLDTASFSANSDLYRIDVRVVDSVPTP